MNEIIMDRTKALVDSMPEDVINNLTNYRRDVRLKALNTIIKSLDEKEENDNHIIQTIPLYLVSIWNFDAAISFLSTIISCNYKVAVEIINEVYKNTILEMQDPEVIEDFEFMAEINRKINLLISTAKKKEWYSENSKFLITLWQDYERKWDFYKAISVYDTLILNWDKIWYLYSALAYKELWETEFAISLLENAYNIYGDKIFLENIIIIYNQLWNINKAKQVYLRLISDFSNKNDKVILPFIMYSFIIEDDSDLKSLEWVMVWYISDNQLIPLESLLQVCKFAELYIDQNIEYIKCKISELEKKWIQDFDLEVQEEYDELIKRKLYLMQTSLTILKDNKYLEEHLDDLDKLVFSWNQEKKDLLIDYFDENYSLLAWEVSEWQKMNIDLYDNLSNYLWLLIEVFFHGKNYNILSKKLFPLLAKSDNQRVDRDENHINGWLNLIKTEADYIDKFSTFLIKLYDELIEKIDCKYWKFLRVRIQELAREDLWDNDDKYPKVLFENKEIALLFWIERMISWNILDNLDLDFYNNLMDKYGFESLDENDACLLAVIMYDKSFDFAINYIISSDLLSKNVYTIYYLLEAFVNYDDKKYLKALIKTINQDIRERWIARGLFDYIRKFIVSRFKKENISDEERSYLLMCSWNLALLQKKWWNIVLANFQEADRYESVEAINQVWSIYELNWYSDEAFVKYKEAFILEQNIDNLSKIISVLLTKKDFEEASKYIQLWLKLKYNMDLYLFSYNLWQDNLENAFSLFIWIINKNIPLIDVPEGTLNLLSKKCIEIVNGKISLTSNTWKLKFLSIYILSKLNLLSKNGNELDIIYNEGLGIFSILDNIELEELPNFLNETLYPICLFDSDILTMFDWEINTTEKVIQIIDYYAFHKYELLLEEWKKSETLEKVKEVQSHINNFIFIVIKYLSKFPEAIDLVWYWNKRYIFTSHKGTDIMSENIYCSLSIN